MRYLVAIVLALTAATVLVTGSSAKGPMLASISGGDLAAPVDIEGVLPEEWFIGDETSAPSGRVSYTVWLTHERPDGDTEIYPSAGVINYYPAHDDVPATILGSDGTYATVDPRLEDALNIAIAGAKDDGGTPLAWYLVPMLAVGLVIGGGLAGRRVLSKGIALLMR